MAEIMRARKITELPEYQAPDDFFEVAVFTHPFNAHRVSIGDNTSHTEEEAIKRVKEIFASGMKVFMLPTK